MTIAVAFYALITSSLLTAAAWLVHALTRATLPLRRFIWAGALGASVLLLLVLPLRLRQDVAMTVVDDVSLFSQNTAPLALVTSASRRLPDWVSGVLASAWALSSLLTAAALLASYRRHRRRIARSPHGVVDGAPVRVTEDIGPAVVGIWRPDIVVPRWLLERPAAEQALVVRHERSHLSVGDPLLLVAGCAAVTAMPWNPAMWHLLARLRLAIELDCDHRLLRDGAPPRAYGSLLIDLTSLLPSSGVGAPAFACHPSHLERRLVAMTDLPIKTSQRRLRLAAAAGVIVLVTLAACGTELPTAAEVEGADLASIEQTAPAMLGLGGPGSVYVLDGVVVDRATAAALKASQITAIEVVRGAEAPVVHIRTTDLPQVNILPLKSQPLRKKIRTDDPYIGVIAADSITVLHDDGTERPLVVLDGVISDQAALNRLPKESIKSVEVVKGAAAKLTYGEPGARGVIVVTTKSAP